MGRLVYIPDGAEAIRLRSVSPGLKEGIALVDFDAKTTHNHDTNFRIQQNLSRLYKRAEIVS